MSVDFYTLFHKALRKQLFAAVERAGAADLDDAASRAALTGSVTAIVAMLRTHARIEDHWFQPVVAKAAPEAHAELAREHVLLEPLTDDIEAALARALVERTAAAGAALYTALHRFTGAYLPHLLREEATMHILQQRVPEAELLARYGAFLASRSADELLADLELMLPAVSGSERMMLMARVGGLPPPLPTAAWQIATRVLARDEVERLRARCTG